MNSHGLKHAPSSALPLPSKFFSQSCPQLISASYTPQSLHHTEAYWLLVTMKPLVGAESGVWPSFDVPPLYNLARASGLFIFFCLTPVMFQLNMTVLSTISRERKQQNTWFVIKTGRSSRPCDVGEKLLFLRGLELQPEHGHSCCFKYPMPKQGLLISLLQSLTLRWPISSSSPAPKQVPSPSLKLLWDLPGKFSV